MVLFVLMGIVLVREYLEVILKSEMNLLCIGIEFIERRASECGMEDVLFDDGPAVKADHRK